MVIQHNLSAMNANRRLGQNVNNQSKSIEKLSSGLRINRAGDDAAGLAVSEKMRSQIRGLEQGSTNAQDAVSLVQTVEGAMEETHSMLQRLKTLATQSATGSYSNSDRDLIQKEVNQLTAEITRIASETTYNGMKLLQGSVSSLSFQVGAEAKHVIKCSFSSVKASALGVSGLSLSTQSAAWSAMTAIDSAIKTLSEKRATLGSVQNRLEHTITATDNTAENLTSAESRIRDTDMAKEMMTYSSENIKVQAAQSMLAQANQTPQGVLSLLQ